MAAAAAATSPADAADVDAAVADAAPATAADTAAATAPATSRYLRLLTVMVASPDSGIYDRGSCRWQLLCNGC